MDEVAPTLVPEMGLYDVETVSGMAPVQLSLAGWPKADVLNKLARQMKPTEKEDRIFFINRSGDFNEMVFYSCL